MPTTFARRRLDFDLGVREPEIVSIAVRARPCSDSGGADRAYKSFNAHNSPARPSWSSSVITDDAASIRRQLDRAWVKADVGERPLSCMRLLTSRRKAKNGWNTPESVVRTWRSPSLISTWIDSMVLGGGVSILPAFATQCSWPRPPHRSRQVEHRPPDSTARPSSRNRALKFFHDMRRTSSLIALRDQGASSSAATRQSLRSRCLAKTLDRCSFPHHVVSKQQEQQRLEDRSITCACGVTIEHDVSEVVIEQDGVVDRIDAENLICADQVRRPTYLWIPATTPPSACNACSNRLRRCRRRPFETTGRRFPSDASALR